MIIFRDPIGQSVVESQKIANLPVLATCLSGALAMLSSEVNGPVTHRSTDMTLRNR